MNKRIIVSVIVLVVLALPMVQNVSADGTVTVTDPTGDLLNSGEQAAPSQYYLAYIDQVEAHVTLSSGTYTFELTVDSTPSDWLTTTWQPTFAPPLDKISISRVNFRWRIFDSSGNFLGALRINWRGDQGGTIAANVVICPPATGEACENASIGAQFANPSSVTYSINQAGNSVTFTISQSDFASLFPTGTQWRSATVVIYGSQTGATGTAFFDRTPEDGFAVLPS